MAVCEDCDYHVEGGCHAHPPVVTTVQGSGLQSTSEHPVAHAEDPPCAEFKATGVPG